MQWLNVILQGVLIGGLYAMFAAGLSLIFGVMRLVNIAHGDLIVLAAYVSLMATQTFGMDPLGSLLLVVPAMALIGYGLQRGLLNRTLGDDLRDDRLRSGTGERRLPREHLPEHTGEGVLIRALVDRMPARLLGRDVLARAEQGAGLGQAVRRLE